MLEQERLTRIMSTPQGLEGQVQLARTNWLDASEQASILAHELFKPGSGYGNPEARSQDEHRLNTARFEADRLFRHYDALDRQLTGNKMLALQSSQRLATWASFAIALAVGVTTIADLAFKLFK